MTPEQKKVYDKIFKNVSTRIMQGVENIQLTQSGRSWEQDNGFYVTHLHIESVKAFGVRINVGIQFLWYNNNSLLYQFYDYPNLLSQSHSTDVYTSDVPINPLGLLTYEDHTVEEFEHYFTLLMIEARKVFDHYAAMKDLGVFKRAIADKYAYDREVEIKHGRSGHGSDKYASELALISLLVGDSQTAIPLLEELAAESPYPFYVERANRLLAYAGNREELLSYVNMLLADGRKALSHRIKILEKRRFTFE